MTKISDTDTTIIHAADAGGLVKATQETISALRRHGYMEHAAVIRRATAQFVAGRSLVEIGTLRRWWALFEDAWDLLANSPIDDPCIADDTADIAASYCYCELVTLGIKPSKSDKNRAPAWSITYDDLNADLNNAYEILLSIPFQIPAVYYRKCAIPNGDAGGCCHDGENRDLPRAIPSGASGSNRAPGEECPQACDRHQATRFA